jgi:hypothetical protein
MDKKRRTCLTQQSNPTESAFICSYFEYRDISDLLLLRKLRRSVTKQQGIDLERLNRGDDKRRGRRAKIEGEDEEEGASEKFGLQSQKSKGDGGDE